MSVFNTFKSDIKESVVPYAQHLLTTNEGDEEETTPSEETKPEDK